MNNFQKCYISSSSDCHPVMYGRQILMKKVPSWLYCLLVFSMMKKDISDIWSWFSAKQSLFLLLNTACKQNTNFIAFGLTWPGLKPMIYCPKGEHINPYLTVAELKMNKFLPDLVEHLSWNMSYIYKFHTGKMFSGTVWISFLTIQREFQQVQQRFHLLYYCLVVTGNSACVSWNLWIETWKIHL